MNAKLTLTVDQSVIKEAKLYAVLHETSVSALVENYLRKITSGSVTDEKPEVSLVRSIKGIVSLPPENDPTKEFIEHSESKHR
ncbi:hypothetical protein GGR28_002527 [Lewinella aquimaris]|uniref:Uncharacterized protein n=1 Tax=Neolewinella aquimaris TaxID=1835722 RepID=A0A840E4A2_9BACT|nr:DUF6364 family protein [Neolewinella aquimaris]MBB4079900.1 hypothetical protein [Neolewinella aquimaris]